MWFSDFDKFTSENPEESLKGKTLTVIYRAFGRVIEKTGEFHKYTISGDRYKEVVMIKLKNSNHIAYKVIKSIEIKEGKFYN